MKDCGMVLADNGSNFFFSGASYSVDASNGLTLTWNDNDIQDTLHGLKSLHFSDFEVIDPRPAVTGLSAQGGAAGTSVTVIGRNFSGAAGRLQVFFGSTPAAVGFSVNDTNAARNTTATFGKAGAYVFVVTITDASGLSVTSTVSVTVKQTLTAITVTPAASTIHVRQTEQLTAVALDQF